MAGLNNWCWLFWPAGASPRCRCPHNKDPTKLAFLPDSVLIPLAVCWAVCSPLQLSKNLVPCSIPDGLVGRDELLAVPRLCRQPWFEAGTVSLDHQHLPTSDLALHHWRMNHSTDTSFLVFSFSLTISVDFNHDYGPSRMWIYSKVKKKTNPKMKYLNEKKKHLHNLSGYLHVKKNNGFLGFH